MATIPQFKARIVNGQINFKAKYDPEMLGKIHQEFKNVAPLFEPRSKDEPSFEDLYNAPEMQSFLSHFTTKPKVLVCAIGTRNGSSEKQVVAVDDKEKPLGAAMWVATEGKWFHNFLIETDISKMLESRHA